MVDVSWDEKTRAAAHYETLFESGKIWYSTKEAAAVLGMSAQFVRDAFDSQEIMGQTVYSSREQGARRIKMIHRDCLNIFLMETANYRPVDFMERMKRLIVRRSPAEIEEMRVWMNRNATVGAKTR